MTSWQVPTRAGASWLPLCLLTAGFFHGLVLPALGQETVPGQPATVAEAARVLDLRTFPLLEGARAPGVRRLASLSYEGKAEVRSGYEFQKKAMLERGWKELSGTYISADSASGSFSRDGFFASVSVFPADPTRPGTVNVMLNQHGNVEPAKLPVPSGATLTYGGPASAIFVTSDARDEAAKQCRALLSERGWQPYGTAGDSLIFKQNAIRLNAMISVAPAQGGKTAIQYSSELLSADLPAPPDPVRAQYADSTTALSFDANTTSAALVDFYRQALGKLGWKPTTDHPIKDRDRETLIFRNPQHDLLTLEFFPFEGLLRGQLEHQTSSEVAERDRLAKQAIERRKMQARPKARVKPIVLIVLPDGAHDVKEEGGNLEFAVANGRAKAVVESLRASLRQAGWKEEVAVLESIAGAVSLSKPDGGSLTVNYTDTGVMPAEVRVSAIGVEVKQGKAESE